MFRVNLFRLMIVSVLFICSLFPAISQAAKFKVLVVMSYEEKLSWCENMKKGIETALGELSEIKYFYMNTMENFEGGARKAEEAYNLFQEFKPDGVIAADDNAQVLFVVPYLKDKVKTPVMFCGVNAEPEQYGYPASNVSGMLERLHMKESIAYAQQIVPSIKTVGYMVKAGPVAEAVLKQVKSESDTYPAISKGFKTPDTLKHAIEMAEELKKDCDLLFMTSMGGLTGNDGKPLTLKEATSELVKAFGKPTFTDVTDLIKHGVLCAVTIASYEQGETSAQMLLKAMQGTPISRLPVAKNKHGKAVINPTALKSLGIKPQPMVFQKAEVMKTEE